MANDNEESDYHNKEHRTQSDKKEKQELLEHLPEWFRILRDIFVEDDTLH